MAERLTDRFVKAAACVGRAKQILWDSDIGGFGLSVTAAGAKSFVLDFRHEGRQRRFTIGAYPAWSVAAARAEAELLRRRVDRGEDPMGERHERRAAPSFADAWTRYEAQHLPKLAPRNAADQRAMWRDDIAPALGKMKLDTITYSEVADLHHGVTASGRATRANRIHEVVRRVFNVARRWGWHDGPNPADGIDRNVEEPRHRYLGPAEVRALALALDAHAEAASARALKLLLLTGARKGEVLAATWDQFDLDEGVWTKPATTTKQRRLHRVPLNVEAVAILREQAAAIDAERRASKIKNIAQETPAVFPGEGALGRLVEVKRAWKSIRENASVRLWADAPDTPPGRLVARLFAKLERLPAYAETMRAAQEDGVTLPPGLTDCRIHDLRHSFASLVISSGASLATVGALLGHTQAQTTQRYAHLHEGTTRAAANVVSLSTRLLSRGQA